MVMTFSVTSFDIDFWLHFDTPLASNPILVRDRFFLFEPLFMDKYMGMRHNMGATSYKAANAAYVQAPWNQGRHGRTAKEKKSFWK